MSVIEKDKIPLIQDYQDYLQKCKEKFTENYNKKGTSTAAVWDDFYKIRTLGAGSYGRVLLVRHKKNNKFYAIKVLDKEKVVNMKQVQHTLNEKKVLEAVEAVRFPFLIYMEFSFKDNSYLYYTMPFVVGGEMFTHLMKATKFDENRSRFYSAQVIMALEFLHSVNVVYRDLKPENILIEKSGYLKVADFGFCKVVNGRTWTLCGTPDYMAPEILTSKGHGTAADWWSFGVLLFEMTQGSSPFTAGDIAKIYEKIINCKYKFTPNFSPELKDLIKNVLQVDLSRRFGNLQNGVNDIKNHVWFTGTDWLEILNQKTKPPFIPWSEGASDTTNFNQYEEKPMPIAEVDLYAKEFKEF